MVFNRLLQNGVGNDEAHAAGADNANQSGEHETVVQNELPDSCRTGTVKADTCQVGRIRRQEEITVACRKERHNHDRIHAQTKRHRHNDSNRRPLRIYKFGSKEQDQAIRPWVLGHHRTEECFQNTHVACKVSISHPCDTVNGNKRHNTRAKYLAVPHFLRFRFAGKENEGGNKSITIWITVVIEIAAIFPFAFGKCGSKSGKLPRMAMQIIPMRKIPVA